MRIFFFLSAVFMINFKADAIDFQCNCRTNLENFHGYSCEVQSIKLASDDDHEVKNVSGTHQSGKSYSDVKYFQLYQKTLKFFPRNLEKFFKHLDQVYVGSSNMETIIKDDLHSLGGQIRKLWINYNKIEVLDADVFSDVINLEFLNLGNNKIQYVGRGTFDSMQKLTSLYFQNNPCYSGLATGNRSAVINLIDEIESKCTNLYAFERHRKLYSKTTENMIEELTKDYEEKILGCRANLQTEKGKNSELNTQVDNLKSNVRKLQQINDELLLEVEAEKVKNTKKKCEEGTLEENIKKRISELEAKLEEKFDAKFKETKNVMETRFNANHVKLMEAIDSFNENLVSVNTTCFVLDRKMDLFNFDYRTEPLPRQP